MDNKELKAKVKEIKKAMKKCDNDLINKATDIQLTVNLKGHLQYSHITYQYGPVASGGIIVHVDTGSLTVKGLQDGIEYTEEINEDTADRIDDIIRDIYLENIIDRFRYRDK